MKIFIFIFYFSYLWYKHIIKAINIWVKDSNYTTSKAIITIIKDFIIKMIIILFVFIILYSFK